VTQRTRTSRPRRVLAWCVPLAVLLLAASAASSGRPARALVLTSGNLPQYTTPAESFVVAHAGEARIVDVGTSKETGRKRIEEAVAQGPVDAVFAVGAPAAWLARQVLPDVPLTFAMVIDWKRYGLGAKESGVLVEMPVDALLTRFKLLLPKLDRLGVIVSEEAPMSRIEEARKAAADLEIELVVARVRYSDDVPGAYRRIRTSISALWMVPDPVVVTRDNFQYLAHRTRSDELPFLAFSENFVRAGALLSVSPDYATIGSQAAALLDRLVDSAGAEHIVQAPIGSSLVVNADTARDLGIDIDATLLSFADKVIDDDPEER
jgi:putative ABC transport system substrate-binding protein